MTARHTSPLQALFVDEKFDGDVYANEPMARHTTYRIGGPARFFVRVNSLTALASVVDICNRDGIPWIVAGRGSNLLVSDRGFSGVILTLGRDFRSIHYDEARHRFIAGAGLPLSAVVQEAFQKFLSGLEFAVGTPGTLGGALRMNAGSRDQWMGSIVDSVVSLTPGVGLKRHAASEIEWGYRSTSFASDQVLLECELTLVPADPYALRDTMESTLERRKRTQPLNEPSCGSVFKNPEGVSAGRLIDELGLKGASVGGAAVSSLHANFIVNRGGATAQDVCILMEIIQAKVIEAYGITLEPEVRFVGFQ